MNKKVVIISLLCVLIIALSVALFWLNQGNQQPATGDPTNTQATVLDSAYDAKLISNIAVANVAVYPSNSTIITARTSAKQTLEEVISTYDLIKVPDFQLYRNADNTIRLAQNYGKETMTLSFSNPTPTTIGINERQALAVATSFLKDIDIEAIPLRNLQYLGATSESEETTASKASYVRIPYQLAFQGHPLLISNQSSEDMSVWVDSNYRILKATLFNSFTVNEASLKEVSLISQNTTLSRVANNEAIITTINSPNRARPFNIESIDNLEITSFRIEYRHQPETQQILPYIGMTAEGVSGGDDVTMEISVRADMQ